MLRFERLRLFVERWRALLRLFRAALRRRRASVVVWRAQRSRWRGRLPVRRRLCVYVRRAHEPNRVLYRLSEWLLRARLSVRYDLLRARRRLRW